jgi:hypothetical protein
VRLKENDALENGLSRVTAGSMKTYTYSTARQRLAEVLEEASREGEVQIRRQDGRVYAVTPVAEAAQSPLANVTERGRQRSDVQRSAPAGARGRMGTWRTCAAQRTGARVTTAQEARGLNPTREWGPEVRYLWNHVIGVRIPASQPICKYQAIKYLPIVINRS